MPKPFGKNKSKVLPVQKAPIFKPENQYIIIGRLVSALGQDNFLKEEGFFRTGGGSLQIDSAFKELAKNLHADLSNKDRDVLTSLLKQFILNPPLLSIKESTKIVEACQPANLNGRNISDVMKKEIDEIMPIEKRTAIFQILKLMTNVAEKSAENKMTAANLMTTPGTTLFILENPKDFKVAGLQKEQIDNLASILDLVDGRNPWADMLAKLPEEFVEIPLDESSPPLLKKPDTPEIKETESKIEKLKEVVETMKHIVMAAGRDVSISKGMLFSKVTDKSQEIIKLKNNLMKNVNNNLEQIESDFKAIQHKAGVVHRVLTMKTMDPKNKDIKELVADLQALNAHINKLSTFCTQCIQDVRAAKTAGTDIVGILKKAVTSSESLSISRVKGVGAEIMNTVNTAKAEFKQRHNSKKPS